MPTLANEGPIPRTTTFVVPLNSHWSGIAFESHGPRLVSTNGVMTLSWRVR